MTGIYGYRWTSNHGVTDIEGIWARGLSGVSGAEIASAMQYCIDERDDFWPPSLPEFRKLCISGRSKAIAADGSVRWDNCDSRVLMEAAELLGVNPAGLTHGQLAEHVRVMMNEVDDATLSQVMEVLR